MRHLAKMVKAYRSKSTVADTPNEGTQMTTPLSTARDVRHHLARARTERSEGIRRCVDHVREANLTYLERRALIDLATLARQTRNTPGVIIEAGSALGGSA